MMSLVLRLTELPLGGSEATVLRWLVDLGTTVVRGQPLVVVLTERAEIVLGATGAGTLVGQVAVGARAAVGGELAQFVIAQPTRISPLARRMAQMHGLDTATLTGSGLGGRVMRSDVVQALGAGQSAAPAAPAAPETVALAQHDSSPLQLAASQPPVSVETQAEPFALVTIETVIRPGVVVERAAVLAALVPLLQRMPQLAGLWQRDGIVMRRRLHVAVDGRLVMDAQDLNARGLARAMLGGALDLTEAAFELSFGAGWWSGGRAGVRAGLHVGVATPRAVAVEDVHGERIVIRNVAMLTLRYDARMATHAEADTFLQHLSALVSHTQ